MFNLFRKIWPGYNEKYEERRRDDRVRDHFTIKFRSESKRGTFDATGRDISTVGLRMATHEKPRKHDMLELTLYFPMKFKVAESVFIKAKVVHFYKVKGMRRPRIGCEFIYEDEGTRELIAKFVQWLKENPYDLPYKEKDQSRTR